MNQKQASQKYLEERYDAGRRYSTNDVRKQLTDVERQEVTGMLIEEGGIEEWIEAIVETDVTEKLGLYLAEYMKGQSKVRTQASSELLVEQLAAENIRRYADRLDDLWCRVCGYMSLYERDEIQSVKTEYQQAQLIEEMRLAA